MCSSRAKEGWSEGGSGPRKGLKYSWQGILIEIEDHISQNNKHGEGSRFARERKR